MRFENPRDVKMSLPLGPAWTH